MNATTSAPPTSPTSNELSALLPFLTPRERAELDMLLVAPTETEAAVSLSFDDWLQQPGVSPLGWRWDWPHLVRMRLELARLIAGEIDRLFIGCPPRHGKSEQNTIRFAAWYLETYPDRRVLICSYSQRLANRFARAVRRLLLLRGVALRRDRRAMNEMELEAGGALQACGRGATPTGDGFDLILPDDLIKDSKEAHSQATRDSTWEWLSVDVMTRLQPGGAIAATMTPWHHDDVSARLKREMPGEWTELRLPALAEPTPETPDPLGRAEGEALWPERYPVAALERLKKSLRNAWWGLFQQRPQPSEGAIWKRAWFTRRYTTRPDAAQLQHVALSWDAAFKAGERNSFYVCTAWAFTHDREAYLLDVYREHAEFATVETAGYALFDLWQERTGLTPLVLVEEKANGAALIQNWRRGRKRAVDEDGTVLHEAHAPLHCIPITPVADKAVRADAVAPICEAKRVVLPAAAPWLMDLEDEIFTFPGAAFDDQMDSSTQALDWWDRRGVAGVATLPTRPLTHVETPPDPTVDSLVAHAAQVRRQMTTHA